MTLLTALISACIGAAIGWLSNSWCAMARDRRDYEPVENEPPRRVMPQIWDGHEDDIPQFRRRHDL